MPDRAKSFSTVSKNSAPRFWLFKIVEVVAVMWIRTLWHRKAPSEAHIMAVGLAVLPIVVFLLAGAAAAQDRDRQWNSCTGAILDLAIDACTAIIQSGQESAKGLSAAYLKRSNAYNGKREYDRAIEDLDQAIRLDPNFAPAFYNRGYVYSGKREYDRAIQDFDQAIRLDPNYALAFNNRGIAYNGKREYDRAIQDYD